MSTIRTLLADATARLRHAGIEVPDRTAAWLLGDVLGRGRAYLLAEANADVAPEQEAIFEAMVARRLAHEPLQYILGYTEFYGLRMEVSPAVLIPRPETEQVVEYALGLMNNVPNPRVLDIGTGSGCIPLAIRHTRPDAVVHACDISPDALAIAQRNATALGLPITLHHADVLADNFPTVLGDRFDLIISNPPYIPDHEAETLAPEVRAHEPHLALFSGDDPLRFYQAIGLHAQDMLGSGGVLVFETHSDYAEAVVPMLSQQGYVHVALQHDYAGRARIVHGRLIP